MVRSTGFICTLLFLFFSCGSTFAHIPLTIREKAGVTTENYPLSFGHIFKQGDITGGIAVSVGGQLLPTQFDIKRRYADNSVKHGVVSVLLPVIQAGEDLVLTLVPTAENIAAGAMTKTQILATGVQSTINLTGLSGSGYSGNLSANLNHAIDEETDLTYWLAGQVVTEVLMNQKLNNSLNAAWEARFYPGWNGIRISNAMENVEGDFRGNIDYAVEIQMGDNDNPLASHYSKTSFLHNGNARWRKVLWIGLEPPEVEVRYDINYFITTGLIPNYDQSVIVLEATMAERFDDWLNSSHDIMESSSIQLSFGTPGNREEIGLLPRWTARYLLSMDNRMKEIMLNYAELFSGAPIHFRESDPNRAFYGHIISIDDRPGLYINRNSKSSPADSLPDPIGDTDTVWSVDRAHQTSYAYVPYMVTGEKFYLDELYFWAGFNLAFGSPEYRGFENGVLHDQVRGEAWGMRNIAEAAALSPDTDVEKAYLEEKIGNNIASWMTEQDRYPLNNWGITSSMHCDGGRPWSHFTENISAMTVTAMEDYMLIVLGHMNELGYDTQPIINWYSEFHINRFTHPDFNWYNGALYRFPIEEDVAPFDDCRQTVRFLQSWKEANDGFLEEPVPYDGSSPANYPRRAMAALSHAIEVSILQELENGSTRTATGRQAYDWLKNDVGHPDVYNDDPTWAIIPRDTVKVCEPGDVNGNGTVELIDVFLALHLASGYGPSGISLCGDVNGDNRIGIGEAVTALRSVAGLP